MTTPASYLALFAPALAGLPTAADALAVGATREASVDWPSADIRAQAEAYQAAIILQAAATGGASGEIKSVKEGDLAVTYAVGTQTKPSFQALYDALAKRFLTTPPPGSDVEGVSITTMGPTTAWQ